MVKNKLNEIILGCVNKNAKCQNEMYNMLHPKMYSYVLRVMNNNYVIAEEIVNDGFIRLFNKISQYNYSGNFEGWARTIFHSAIINHVEANKKHKDKFREIPEFGFDIIENDNSLSELYYQDLISEIDKLSEMTKKVFNMFIFDCKTHKEISETLGISVGTSKWYIFESRKQLINKINKLNIVY
jgi:RNA polymerase sigma-70 factor (ECF subfamily)